MSVTRDASFPVTSHNVASGTGTTTWPGFTTPGANRFCVALLIGNGSAATALITFTSPNLTWTNRVVVIDAAVNWRVEIYTAFAASVVTSEVISSTHSTTGGPNYAYRDLLIYSFDGSDASGAGNTASINNWAAAANPALSVTATAAGSYLLLGFPYRSAGTDIAVDSNSTTEYDAGLGGGFGFNSRAVSRTSSGAGALTLGFTGTPFAAESLGAMEVKATSGGGGNLVAFVGEPQIGGSPLT